MGRRGSLLVILLAAVALVCGVALGVVPGSAYGQGAPSPTPGAGSPVPPAVSDPSKVEPPSRALGIDSSGSSESSGDNPAKDVTVPQGSADVAPEITAQEPPVLWDDWSLSGCPPGAKPADKSCVPLEREEALRAFFAAELKSYRPWASTAEERLKAFAANIGYTLLGVTRNELPDGRRGLTIHVREITLVRRVDVDIYRATSAECDVFRATGFLAKVFFLDRMYTMLCRDQISDPFDIVFRDEIRRRMRLKPGSPLAFDKTELAEQLGAESDRIADYLRNEGYIDAQVGIDLEPGPDHTAILEVDVVKGTRYTINPGALRIFGNDSIRDEEIRRIFEHGQWCVLNKCLRARYPFSRQNLNRDLQKVVELYQKRGFPAARVRTDFSMATSPDREENEVKFAIMINERRKISVVFQEEGGDASRFPDTALQKLLTFNEEGSYDDVEVVASAEAIRRYYQSRGYFEATVTTQRQDFSFFDRIIFEIHPGPRLRVTAVSFTGHTMPTDALRAAITTESGGFITSDELTQDAARLTEYYRQQGFPDAKVEVQVSRCDQKDRCEQLLRSAPALTALVIADLGGEELHIRFAVEEGQRVTIEDVLFEFPGVSARPNPELRRRADIKPGSPYTLDRINRGKTRLQRWFFANAAPRAEVSIVTRPGSKPGQIVAIYQIANYDKVYFGDVLVSGNFKTEDWVILSELGYERRGELTLRSAEAGPRKLRASGLFNAVDVDFVNLENSKDEQVNVMVRVQERYDYTMGIELAGGYSSDNGFFGEVGTLFPNIAGKGMSFDLRTQCAGRDVISASPCREFLSFEGNFVAPVWLIRRYTRLPLRFDAKAFWRSENTERFGALTSFGTSSALSWRFDRPGRFFNGWVLSARYDLRQRNRDEPLIRTTGTSEDIEQIPVTTRTASIGPQLVIDRRRDKGGRPNPLTPTDGYRIELRALWAHPYLLGQDHFWKVGMSAQHFWQPASRLVVSNGFRYDQGFPRGEVLLPEVERFFAGGDSTVRGFEEDRLATETIESRDPQLGAVTTLRVLPAGGNLRFIHNIELQLNVWEIRGIPVASALFFDTGLVSNSLDEFSVLDLRHSVGVALFRLVTPFSSMSFEWAIPIDPEIRRGDDPRGRFHFNVGLIF